MSISSFLKEEIMQTKGSIENLINRYKTVLNKCRLMNTFGSLAAAAMLTLGRSRSRPGDGRLSGTARLVPHHHR